jgi:acylphosphatase
VVSGRVQGVGFRYFAQAKAARLGLSGWVRNRGYDEVEVVAEGPEEDLRRLLADLREGPSMAHVDDVRVSWTAARGDLPSPFAVAPSAWTPPYD